MSEMVLYEPLKIKITYFPNKAGNFAGLLSDGISCCY